MATHNPTRIASEPGKQDFMITREFNAPCETVFRAFTDPKMYTQWVGPKGYSTTIETFEPKKGGKYRYIQRDKDGKEYAFHGVYHEVKSPEIIIDTFEYEGLPETGHAALESVKFEPLSKNRTRIIAKTVFFSTEDRDGMLESGMEQGIKESLERLDDLLEKRVS